MESVKDFMYNVLMYNSLSRTLFMKMINARFPGSAVYWEKRYRNKGNSGMGSYGQNAVYKAAVINEFVLRYKIERIIDFGCGDGNQLKFFNFPHYFGLDISSTAIQLCKQFFKNDFSKQFYLYSQDNINAAIEEFNADLSISLDVIFHLVEDEIFEKYMKNLFMASSRFVIIYAWNIDDKVRYHVRQRNFSKWIKNNITNFQLKEIKENRTDENYCNFFIYERYKNKLFESANE